MVKYWEIDLIFYAIVPKLGNLNCLFVQESEKIFNDLGLTMVEFKDYGVFDNKKKFLRKLKDISWEVTSAPIETDQEGCVLYFENE